MENTQFTDNELDYINDNVFDSTNGIYAYSKYPNMPKFLPNCYTIVCIDLPLGSYSLKGKNIDFHFNTKYMLVYGNKNFIDERYTESDAFNFIVRKPCDRILFQVKKCKYSDIENLIKELRKQSILNQRKLEQANNVGL